jgi:hypothetical protein
MKISASDIPKWFATAISILYASGFLIVSSYFDRFGIGEATIEFFRIKYLQVGILFSLFPISLLAAPVVITYLRESSISNRNLSRTEKKALTIRALLTTLLICIILLTSSIIAMLAPRGFFRGNWFSILIIFLAIIGMARIKAVEDNFLIPLEERFIGKNKGILINYLFRITLLLAVSFFSIPLMFTIIKPIFRNLFIGLSSIITILTVIYFLILGLRDAEKKYPPDIHIKIRFLAVCVVGALHYFAILGFSYGIYPFISFHRGGGNFCTAPDAVLIIKKEYKKEIPETIINKNTKDEDYITTMPVKIVEESPTSFYVMRPLCNDYIPVNDEQQTQEIIGIRRIIVNVWTYEISAHREVSANISGFWMDTITQLFNGKYSGSSRPGE